MAIESGAVPLGIESVGKSRLRIWSISGAVPATGFLIVLILWQLVSFFTSKIVLPSPGDVIVGVSQLASSGALGSSLVVSIREMYLGLLIGGAAGMMIGICLGVSDFLDSVLLVYVNVGNSVPGLVLIPILAIIFGLGLSTHIIFVSLLSFFPMLINARSGAKSASNRYKDLANIFRISPLRSVLKMTLPACTPFLFSGLRLSIGASLVGMIIAEMEISESGLGYLLINLGISSQTAKVIGVVMITACFGVVQVGLLRLVESKWLSWMASA